MVRKSPVKLLYVTTIPLTQWAFLRGQSRFMADRGFELHCVSSPGPLLDKLAARDGAAVYPVPISREIDPLHDLVSLVRLVNVFRRVRPDVAHLSTPKAALLGAIAAWLTRVPVKLFLVRGVITENALDQRRRVYAWIEWLTARLCDCSVFVSPSLLEFARREKIVGPDEGLVLARGMSNGVDATRFDPQTVRPADLPALDRARRHVPADEPTRVIGFVGRLTRDKGIEDLATAWRAVRERFPQSVLLLVGPWESEDAVSPALRAELENDPRVVRTGQLDDVVPVYRAMDLFVYPSHGTEGFPNGPMEAASMALPVVATRVVGCVDAVVPGVTGALVPPRDPDSLAAAISAYLSDGEMRRAHGAAGRQRIVREFQPRAIWEALYDQYRRLLDAAATRGQRPVRAPAPDSAAAGPRPGSLYETFVIIMSLPFVWLIMTLATFADSNRRPARPED